MNVREAIKVLADGGKVADCDGDVWSMDDDGRCYFNGHEARPSSGCAPFRPHVEPATDEELIAEMERLQAHDSGKGAYVTAAVYQYCAEMLRTRKVKP